MRRNPNINRNVSNDEYVELPFPLGRPGLCTLT